MTIEEFKRAIDQPAPVSDHHLRKHLHHDVLGIDPGPRESAYCHLRNGIVMGARKVPNEIMLGYLQGLDIADLSAVVIETIFPRGQSVGLDTMDTQFWAGRFAQVCDDASAGTWHKIDRQDVRFAICGSLNTNDSSVRTALLDMWGGSKDAIGTKKEPGPLKSIKADMWSALAIAVAWQLRRV
jgi:hypothetical protein